MAVVVQGLEPLEGDTAFAFLVLRLRAAVDRDGVLEVLRFIAPLIPDADAFIDEFPEELDGALQIIGIPWAPAEAGHGVSAQRRLIDGADAVGVEAAWFFQTGTSLPSEPPSDSDEDDDDDDDEDDDDDLEDDAEVDDADTGSRHADVTNHTIEHGKRASTTTGETIDPGEAWGSDLTDTRTIPIELVEADEVEPVEDDRRARRPTVVSPRPLLAELEELQQASGEIGSSDDSMTELPSSDPDDDSLLDVRRADEAADADRDADADGGAGDDDGDDDDDDAEWSNGPPPQAMEVRFPVDNYPAIIDELDWEDFGVAFKLAGTTIAGENTVLLGFHTLWLAPYADRYRNTAVTIDPKHHSAHLWVDRFAVPCSPTEQVHHLLWILSKLDQVLPIIHARFAPASMAQKFGGLVGEANEPFVLGGNPLLAIHREGGEPAVDAWIAKQTEWSNDEVAQMLRELAVEVVSAGDLDTGDDDEDADADEEDFASLVDDEDEDDDEGDEDDEELAQPAAPDEPARMVAEPAAYDRAEEPDDDRRHHPRPKRDEVDEDEDRGRHITTYAGDVLRARALAGTLDPRVAPLLLPVLAHAEKYEHRRKAVVEILGALRYQPAVPHLIEILTTTPIANALDSIGKEDFVAATAAALGAIGDPAAIPALSKVVAAAGMHNDKPRPIAAEALAVCLAASPDPHSVDEAVLAELLTTIHERNDGELNAETHFAYGRLARQLPPNRRAEARRRLAEVESARDDATAMLARQAALVLASPTTPPPALPPELRALLHEALTALDYDHDSTIRNLRVALRVAEVVPEIVDPTDLVPLTRFAEPDLRASAHAILAKIGKPLPNAATFDAAAARKLDDRELLRALGEAHVVGRGALIAEAGRRSLAAARRPIIDACNDVITRARVGGANLLDHDSRVLEAAIRVLRTSVDGEVAALFDRLLRHSNFHVKWELLQDPPADKRLIGGMFHVQGEKWGWQAKTAKAWLAKFHGTPEYESERKRIASALPAEDDDEEIN